MAVSENKHCDGNAFVLADAMDYNCGIIALDNYDFSLIFCPVSEGEEQDTVGHRWKR